MPTLTVSPETSGPFVLVVQPTPAKGRIVKKAPASKPQKSFARRPFLPLVPFERERSFIRIKLLQEVRVLSPTETCKEKRLDRLSKERAIVNLADWETQYELSRKLNKRVRIKKN